jgi:hypothetical protein
MHGEGGLSAIPERVVQMFADLIITLIEREGAVRTLSHLGTARASIIHLISESDGVEGIVRIR